MKTFVCIISIFLLASNTYAIWPFSVDHITLAGNMIKQGKYTKATNILENLIYKNNTYENTKKDALFLLGLIKFIEHEDIQAYQYFQRVIDLDKKSYRSFFYQGIILLKDDNSIVHAIPKLETALSLLESEKVLIRRNDEIDIVLCYLMMTKLGLKDNEDALKYANRLYFSSKNNACVYWSYNVIKLLSKNENIIYNPETSKQYKIRSAILDSMIYYCHVKIPIPIIFPNSIEKLEQLWYLSNLK